MPIDWLEAAEAAQVLADRRAKDALVSFVPTPPQVRFLTSTKPHAFFLAGNRSGKSKSLAAVIASYARWGVLNPLDVLSGKVQPNYEPKRIWLVGVSLDRLWQNFVPSLFGGPFAAGQKPFIPPEEIDDISLKRGTCQLKNGSLIALLSHEAGRDKFQGAAVHLIGFDEAPPKGIWEECSVRASGGEANLFLRMAATLLPPVGTKTSVSWLYEKVVKPHERKENTENVDLINAGMKSNPHIDPSIIRTFEALFPPGSVDHQIRIEGKLIPHAFGAPVYGNFFRSIHVNPKLTRTSVDPRKPLLLSFDVNVRPMTAVVAQDFGNIVRVVDEIFLCHDKGATLIELAQEFRRRFPVHGAELRVYGDATSAHQNSQTTKTDYDVFLNELVGYPAPVVPCIPTSNPFVHDRINTVNYILRGPGGQVCVEIAPHCKELIADLEEVQADGKGGILKSRDAKDPYYLRTHISDAFGYLAWAIRPITIDDRLYSTRGQVVRSIPSPNYQFGRTVIPTTPRRPETLRDRLWQRL